MTSSSPMLDRLTSDEQRAKDAKAEKTARQTQRVLTYVLVALIAWGLGRWIYSLIWPSEIVTEISISKAVIVGESEVCPGDTLHVAYEFSGDGVGAVELDATTSTISETVAYSERKRDIYNREALKVVHDEWIVTELPPGEYQRNVAVSSTNRSTAFDNASVIFTVRACGAKELYHVPGNNGVNHDSCLYRRGRGDSLAAIQIGQAHHCGGCSGGS